VRAKVVSHRRVAALPPVSQSGGRGQHEAACEYYDPEPLLLGEGEPSVRMVDLRRGERALAAYRAADPVQPRPGLIVRRQA
jgi:hypothetical protein